MGLDIEEARRGVLPRGPIPWSMWLGLINNKYQIELLDTFQRKVRGATPYFVSRYMPYLKAVNDKLGYELFEKDLELKSTLTTDVLGRNGIDFLSFTSDMQRIAPIIKIESKEKKDGLFCRLLMLIQ